MSVCFPSSVNLLIPTASHYGPFNIPEASFYYPPATHASHEGAIAARSETRDRRPGNDVMFPSSKFGANSCFDPPIGVVGGAGSGLPSESMKNGTDDFLSLRANLSWREHASPLEGSVSTLCPEVRLSESERGRAKLSLDLSHARDALSNLQKELRMMTAHRDALQGVLNNLKAKPAGAVRRPTQIRPGNSQASGDTPGGDAPTQPLTTSANRLSARGSGPAGGMSPRPHVAAYPAREEPVCLNPEELDDDPYRSCARGGTSALVTLMELRATLQLRDLECEEWRNKTDHLERVAADAVMKMEMMRAGMSLTSSLFAPFSTDNTAGVESSGPIADGTKSVGGDHTPPAPSLLSMLPNVAQPPVVAEETTNAASLPSPSSLVSFDPKDPCGDVTDKTLVDALRRAECTAQERALERDALQRQLDVMHEREKALEQTVQDYQTLLHLNHPSTDSKEHTHSTPTRLPALLDPGATARWIRHVTQLESTLDGVRKENQELQKALRVATGKNEPLATGTTTPRVGSDIPTSSPPSAHRSAHPNHNSIEGFTTVVLRQQNQQQLQEIETLREQLRERNAMIDELRYLLQQHLDT